MNALILEGNKGMQDAMKDIIQRHCPEIETLKTASDVEIGKQIIEETLPDVTLLDLELPDGKSFDLIDDLKGLDFQPIFVAKNERYALQAIKRSALDYILKPVDQVDLIRAVSKVTKTKETHTLQQGVTSHIKVKTNRSKKKLILKDQYGFHVVYTDQIIRLEANGSYTNFFLRNGHSLCISKNISDHEGSLPAGHFFRCHKSHLINLNHLSRFDKREGDQLFMNDGSSVPLAYRKKERFLNLFE
ncbi:MAG: LytTR family DNA-binding domain-containing protein [Bacteroidota bacterium]